jgi:hypothetical protein
MRLLGPIIGATLIVILAWGAAQFQATAEVFVAASLAFSILEGIILAFVGAAFSSRSVVVGVIAACITALLAAPGRWEVAYLRNGQSLQPMDLLIDLGATIAWGAFCGLAGATVLRRRLLTLLPRP